MAATQSVPSEVEKSEQEDPVKEVIRWVVKALLQEEALWRHFDIGSIICSGVHFWRHWFNMATTRSKFGELQLVMVNYGCGFNIYLMRYITLLMVWT